MLDIKTLAAAKKQIEKTNNNDEFNAHIKNSNIHITSEEREKLNKDFNDQVPTFTQADSRENIASGEKMSTIFGKVKKWLADLKPVAFTGSYNDLANKPEIPVKTRVKGDAESTYRTGNVNLTPANIGALPLTGGTTSGMMYPYGGIKYAGKDRYIAYPEDGYFNYTGGDITGFLQISLPYTWCSTSIKFTVSIFDYSTGTSVDYIISGYNYEPGKRWNSCTALCVGNPRNTIANLPVNFGHDGTNCAVSIGKADTVWHFPGVQVHSISMHYSNVIFARWYTGWNVNITTDSLKGGITHTEYNPHIAYRGVSEYVVDSHEPNNHNLNLSFSLNKPSMDSAKWLGAWDSANRELRAINTANVMGVGSALRLNDSFYSSGKNFTIPSSGEWYRLGYFNKACGCYGEFAVYKGWSNSSEHFCKFIVSASTGNRNSGNPYKNSANVTMVHSSHPDNFLIISHVRVWYYWGGGTTDYNIYIDVKLQGGITSVETWKYSLNKFGVAGPEWVDSNFAQVGDTPPITTLNGNSTVFSLT